jgi:uncharacterized repeat protein (TIGR01451 family)
MRSKSTHSPPGRNRKVGIILLTILLLVAFTASSAFAILRAGNTIIRNTATVDYLDGGGTAQSASDTIDVTVNTVDSAPLVVFNPATGATTGAGDTQAYTVTVMTTANGPETITVGNATDVAADADGDMTVSGTGPAFTAWTTPQALFLGATVIDPSDAQLGAAQSVNNAATITFVVPNDGGVPTDAATTGGGTGDSIINGLTIGDTVYLYDGAGTYHGVFDVTAVTDPAVGLGATAATGSITLQNNTGAAIGFTPADGWQIVEAATDTLTVTQGTIDDPTDPEWESTFDVTMGGETTTATVTTDASEATIALNKYVRNVDTANGTGTSFVYPALGETYYDSGVNGNPTETLEYLIHIENTGAAAGTSVILTDDIPTYTTYTVNSVAVDTNGDGTFDVTMPGDSAGSGDGIITVSGSTITVYLGTGGSDAGAGTGGSIAGSAIVAVKYRVSIQ